MGVEIPPLTTVNTVMDTQLEDKTTNELDIAKPKQPDKALRSVV